jgi:hypothetical protein
MARRSSSASFLLLIVLAVVIYLLARNAGTPKRSSSPRLQTHLQNPYRHIQSSYPAKTLIILEQAVKSSLHVKPWV